MLSSLSCGLRLFGDASSESALCFGRPPLSRVRQCFSGSLNALARRDALTPMSVHNGRPTPLPGGTPCAHGRRRRSLIPMLARLRSVIQREYRSLRRGSSLFASEGDYSHFNQGSVFSHISCFAHNHICASMKFAFALFNMEGLKGGHRFSGLP
jgi:hypothetical protein